MRSLTVCPNARSRAQVRVGWKERGFVVWVGFFEELAEHCAFIQRLAFVLQSRDKTARVQIQQ